MLKSDEINKAASCWNKAREDERMFILLERDLTAPVIIRAWVTERLRVGLNTATDKQILEALQCADLMEQAQVDAG